MGVMPKHKVGRNDLCPCGSGLKSKFCHGDPLKVAVCTRYANEKMVQLIRQEQKKRGLIPMNYECKNCGHKFDEPKTSVVSSAILCPKCDNTSIEEIEK